MHRLDTLRSYYIRYLVVKKPQSSREQKKQLLLYTSFSMAMKIQIPQKNLETLRQ